MPRPSIPPSLDNLTQQLHRLPGIGKKTAQRLALHILRSNEDAANELANAIFKVKKDVKFCGQCFNITEGELCNVCSDSRRDRSTLCVVEDIVDIIAIENSNEYNGLYHVLGGVISPLAGISPEDLKINELLIRVKSPEVAEVLLALNPSTEGEATMIYLSRLLKDYDIKVTRIASGIPFGAHLEFIDDATIGRAIQSRREI
jgi:recombination protein RecR